MIYIEKLDIQVADLLLESGWYQNRCLDVSHVVAELEREGFRGRNESIDILSSLYGIKVHTYKTQLCGHEFYFEPRDFASGDYDKTQSWRRRLNVDFFPLGGEERTGSAIWCGDDGRFYFGLDFGLHLVGDTIYQALATLFLPNQTLETCAD